MKFILSSVCGLEVSESLGVTSVLARIWSYLLDPLLLKKEDPPQCLVCDCRLTVKHILVDCFDFIEFRNRHFNENSFKELFEKVPPDHISSYLREIRVTLFYNLFTP